MGDKGGVARVLRGFLVALAPPALLEALGAKWVAEHLWVAALIVVLYELVVLCGGFILRVWRIIEAEFAKQLAAWIISAVTRRLAGYQQSYRQGVRLVHRYFDDGGLSYRGANPAAIEDVFVDVRLVQRPPGQISDAMIATGDADPEFLRLSIWRFLEARKSEPERLTIIGPPGSGKTTLLRHITLTLTSKRPRGDKPRRSIPVLLFLRDCFSEIVSNPKATSLPNLIETQVEPIAGKPPKNWFEQRLREGQCVVMFDGVDEIADQSDRQAVLEWIHNQEPRYANNYFLVTSRPRGSTEYSHKDGTVLQVREFTPAQIRAYVHGWYRSAERSLLAVVGGRTSGKAVEAAERLLARVERTALAQLAANPLLLTMICRVNHHKELPTTRPELYQEFCDVLLENWQRGKKLPDPLRPGEKVSVLRELAFTMIERRLENPSAEEMVEMIAAPLRRISTKIGSEEFLLKVRSTGLLTQSEHGDYGFVHKTFCEYLAATAIVESGQLEVLLDNVADTWWRETSLFYAAIRGADRIVEACLESDKSAALTLAFACEEVDRDLDSELRRRLQVLLTEAIDPNVPAERRRLAAAITATRELRPVISLADEVRACNAPVSRQLFEIFVSQSRAEFSGRDTATDQDVAAKAPAVGVKEPEVHAFLTWLNHLADDQRTFRLPTRSETEVARFAPNDCCVWLASTGDPQELDLWVPPGVEHPYVVSDGQLRERAEADCTEYFGKALATVLSFALAHTLAVADTLLHVRSESRGSSRTQTLAAGLRQKLDRIEKLALAFIDELAPGTESELHRALTSALDFFIAMASLTEFSDDLARTIATSLGKPRDHALDLAILAARFRASDLWTSVRVLVPHVIDVPRQDLMISLPRPSGRPPADGQILSHVLDRALDQALGLIRHSAIDLDVPTCLLFARQVPVEGVQQKALDPVWGTALDAVLKQRNSHAALPSSLARMCDEAKMELPALIADSDDTLPAERLTTVATRVHDLVDAITDPEYSVTPGNISYARLGAVSLAANLARDHDRSTLASKYLGIAVGVTSIERQFLGHDLPQETMILVQA